AATSGQPAILLGSSNGAATLNLNGGFLTLAGNGTGAGIIHTTPGANSNAFFNGTQLKVGTSHGTGMFITQISNASVQTGGLKIDTNGVNIVIDQIFKHDA